MQLQPNADSPQILPPLQRRRTWVKRRYFGATTQMSTLVEETFSSITALSVLSASVSASLSVRSALKSSCESQARGL